MKVTGLETEQQIDELIGLTNQRLHFTGSNSLEGSIIWIPIQESCGRGFQHFESCAARISEVRYIKRCFEEGHE